MVILFTKYMQTQRIIARKKYYLLVTGNRQRLNFLNLTSDIKYRLGMKSPGTFPNPTPHNFSSIISMASFRSTACRSRANSTFLEPGIRYSIDSYCSPLMSV